MVRNWGRVLRRVFWLLLFLSLPVHGQESETVRRRVIEHPIRPPAAQVLVDGLKYPFSQLGKALERGTLKVEKDHVLDRLQNLLEVLEQKGYQPLFGGLGTGAGFPIGVNLFRENFLGTGLRLDVPLQYSSNGYAGLGTHLTFPLLSGERLFLKAGLDYEDRPQEDFFGLGPSSSKADRSNFELEKRTVQITLAGRPFRGVTIGFPLAFFNGHVSPGTDDRFPDLQERFSAAALAGAERGAELVSGGVFLTWDYRDSVLRPRAGGMWALETAYVRDTEAQDFRFMRYRLETAHYLPLDDEHVVALRGLGIFNDEKGRAGVPFFLKAVLGGKETMRGFREFRFYDDNALLFSAEYRWRIWSFADAVLFVDEGQVAPEPGDFSWGNFRNSRGVGLRFQSERSQLTRVDVGHSREGWRFYVSFSPAF